MIEERFRKIENEELLRIFPINTVVGTRKLTEENEDKKRFSFLLNKSFLFTTSRVRVPNSHFNFNHFPPCDLGSSYMIAIIDNTNKGVLL